MSSALLRLQRTVSFCRHARPTSWYQLPVLVKLAGKDNAYWVKCDKNSVTDAEVWQWQIQMVGMWVTGLWKFGEGGGGRCSSWKLASESFNTLPWITVSHSLTTPNHKRLCVHHSHDLTGSIAFSGCSPNVFLSRFDEISRWWYVTLRTNEWALDLCDWTVLLAALTEVTVRGDSQLL